MTVVEEMEAACQRALEARKARKLTESNPDAFSKTERQYGKFAFNRFDEHMNKAVPRWRSLPGYSQYYLNMCWDDAVAYWDRVGNLSLSVH